MKTLLTFILLYISVFVASAQRISDFPNNSHPANSDLMLFQSGNTNFNTTFSQLQTALSTNIGTSSNSINAVYVTHNPLTNSILGNAATASSATNFFGLLSNTNLPNPLDLSHGSNLPPTAITSGGAVSGQILSWNGLYWVPVTATAGTNSSATNVVWPVIGDTHAVGVTNGLTVTLTVPWTPMTNEFWISSQSVANPDGTQLRPFDGSTQPKFDALMVALEATNKAARFRLTGGQFLTSGSLTSGWSLTNNQQLVGAGMDVTTIKVIDGVIANTYAIRATGTNIVIADLSVNCNGANNAGNVGGGHPEQKWGNGVAIVGQQGTIRNVHVYGGKGNHTWGAECFHIFVGPHGTTSAGCFAGNENTVENCLLDGFDGDYSDGVVTSGGATIRGCRTYFPTINFATSNVNWYCYNINWAIGGGTRIENCYGENGEAGVYTDTGFLTNSSIVDCTFYKCVRGIMLNHGSVVAPDDTWGVDGVQIIGNRITLRDSNSGSGNWNTGLYSERHVGNVVMMGNIISGGNTISDSTVCYLNQGWNFSIMNNIWDDRKLRFQATFVPPDPVVTNLVVFNNYSIYGGLATNILQTNITHSIVANNFIGNGVLVTNVPLSSLSQSGALVGYIPAWDGSAWVPIVPPSGGGSGTGIQTNSGSGINNTFTNVNIVSGSIYGGAVTSVVSSATTAVTASSVIAGITNTWRTDATNAAAFYSQSATNAAALNAMGFALLSDATNAANKASQNSTNTTRLNANGLALLTDVTNEANFATQNSTNTTKLNANGLALKTDATNAALGSIAPYAINATNVLVNILTNKLDGTNLISGGATAGQVPVADGTGKVAWGGVNASQSPLTNNVNAAGFSGTNYGTLQATNFDINGTGEPILSLYDAGGNLMAGFVSSNWFGNGAGLSNVVPARLNVTKTSNYNLTSADNGTTFNNQGAGTVTNFLPAATVNLHYYFALTASANMYVKANGTDTINYANAITAPGGYLLGNLSGDCLHLFCPIAGKWLCDNASGSYSWTAH